MRRIWKLDIFQSVCGLAVMAYHIDHSAGHFECC